MQIDTQQAGGDVLQSAAAMVPELRELSGEVERRRCLSRRNVDLVISAGIVRMLQPEEFGGLGLSMEDVIETGFELGRGCGATTWMAVQWPVHNFMVGSFPQAVQEMYWADSPDTLSSTCGAGPVSLAEADGGRVASGKLKLSSGVDWAAWLMVLSPDGVFLLEAGQFEIIDDWHVAGLKGTGSKSVAFRDVFVPEERIISHEALFRGKTQAATKAGSSAFYRVPLAMWAAPGLTAAVVGMAGGVVEQFAERSRGRRLRSGKLAVTHPGTQYRYAEASAEVESSQQLLRNAIRDARRWGESGCDMPRTEELRLLRNTAFASRQAMRAVARVSEASDSSAALYDQYLLQRLARDARAGSLHPSQAWDDTAIQFSRDVFGLDGDEASVS